MIPVPLLCAEFNTRRIEHEYVSINSKIEYHHSPIKFRLDCRTASVVEDEII